MGELLLQLSLLCWMVCSCTCMVPSTTTNQQTKSRTEDDATMNGDHAMGNPNTMAAATSEEARVMNSPGNESQYTADVKPYDESPTDYMSIDVTTAQHPCLSLCSCDILNKHVDCSAQGLTHIPSDLPSDLIYLDLSNNNLSQVDVDKLGAFQALERLDLGFNKLSKLSTSAFSNNKLLHSLHLNNNHFTNDLFYCENLNNTPSVNTTYITQDETSSEKCNSNISSLQTLVLSNNRITQMQDGFLDIFPQLHTVILDYNHLIELPGELVHDHHPLEHLSLISNHIQTINCASFQYLSELRKLDLAYNQLLQLPQMMCSEQLERLTTLTLSGNPLNVLSPRAFMNLTSLTVLDLSHLQSLQYLPKYVFMGLPSVQYLHLSHNPSLEFIHADAFAKLDSLEVLDLSYCGLSWLHMDVLQNLTGVKFFRLDGNPWHCDCDLIWLPRWLDQQANIDTNLHQTILCTSPPNLAGHDLNTSISAMVECQGPVMVNSSVPLWFKIGSQAVLDCLTAGNAKTKVIWISPKKQELEYYPGYHNFYESDPTRAGYHEEHIWHGDTAYYDNHTFVYKDRITVLYNGSLYLDYVTRKDAGNYTCTVDNGSLNDTIIVQFRIDSQIQWFKIYTIIWGMICAFTFFFITMVISTIHFYAVKCSSKERKRRKGIREVLNSLHDFKTVQIDRLCAYKTAKLNKLWAFKNAKMHKLVAFKTAKVDKLRNYKQVTMASIFLHMEKMREHYNSQMNRVRDNCSQQAEKLRENYTSQLIKIKDYKSEKIVRIRDNYNGQVLKIREARSYQMDKLRDQYKVQQQHLFKLMELLDIGNCLHVVEAECMRTESMIFDPNISFDLEAEPVHIQRDMDMSENDSEYMTAGSHSDLSLSDNALRVHVAHTPPTNGEPKQKTRKKHRSRSDHHRRQASDTSESSGDQTVHSRHIVSINSEPPPPPNFSCDIPHLDNKSLSDLVAATEAALLYSDKDDDQLSMYHTPANSEHQDIESATQPIPRHTSAARNANSISNIHVSVTHSREQSPEPTYYSAQSEQHIQQPEEKSETFV